MTFFSDVKIIVSSSSSAIGNGAKLLAQGASQLNKLTIIASLRLEIINLEGAVKQNIRNFETSVVIDQQLTSINDKYLDLIEISDASTSETLQLSSAQLLTRMKSLQKDIAIEKIGSFEEAVEKQNFPSPSLHKLALTSLVTKIRNANEYFGDDYQDLRIKYESRISALNDHASELEKQRHTRSCTTYPSGVMKSSTQLRDGEKHGERERWYKNGKRLSTTIYSKGKFTGNFSYWRQDGSIHTQFTTYSTAEKISQKVFLRDGTVILNAQKNQEENWVELFLWNGTKLGRTKLQKNKQLDRIIAFKALFRPSVFVCLVKARKPGNDQNGLNHMSETFEEYTEIATKLERLLHNYP